MASQIKIFIGALTLFLFLAIGAWVFFAGFSGKSLQPSLVVQTDKTEYSAQDYLKVKIKNNFKEEISFSLCYPYYLEKINGDWQIYQYEECFNFNGNGHSIGTGQEKAFELPLSFYSSGRHRIVLPVCLGCQAGGLFREDGKFYSNEFVIK